MEGERLYRTKGIILRRRDFDEADRLLSVLTQDHGKVTLLAKGARKISSHKAAHVDLFRQVDLLVHQGRNFGIISQAESLHCFPRLQENLECMAAAHYMAELVDCLVAEEDEAGAVYELLALALRWLDEEISPDLVQRYFELHLLDYSGYRPQLYRCLGCDNWLQPEVNVFDIYAGGMYCPRCAGASGLRRPVSLGAQKVLRFLQRSEAEECGRLLLRQPLAEELESLLGAYIRQVLERSPRSCRFIDAVRALPAEEE